MGISHTRLFFFLVRMFLNTTKISCGKFPRRDTTGKVTFLYPAASCRNFGCPELSVRCCISRLTASYINLTARNSTTRFLLAFCFALFQTKPRGRHPQILYCLSWASTPWFSLKKGKKKGQKESGGTVSGG